MARPDGKCANKYRLKQYRFTPFGMVEAEPNTFAEIYIWYVDVLKVYRGLSALSEGLLDLIRDLAECVVKSRVKIRDRSITGIVSGKGGEGNWQECVCGSSCPVGQELMHADGCLTKKAEAVLEILGK